MMSVMTAMVRIPYLLRIDPNFAPLWFFTKLRLITLHDGRAAGCHELCVCQIPSSAQRLVELNDDEPSVDLCLRESNLGGIESLQSVENFHIAGKPFQVPHT